MPALLDRPMVSRPSRIIFSSVLDEGDRARLLAIPSFKAVEQLPAAQHQIDLHLFRLGLIGMIRQNGKVKLTPAGRVVRRLLQELEQCSAQSN